MGILFRKKNSRKEKNNIKVLTLKIQTSEFAIHDSYLDEDFYSHIRMVYSTVQPLINLLEKNWKIRTQYLANEGAMMSIAELFNIAKSTANKCTKEVISPCDSLLSKSSNFIFWPNLEDTKL